VDTQGRGLIDIGARVTPWIAAQGVEQGLLTLFCRHTSASLLIQENAAPAARADLLRFFETIAPEDPERYQHDEEGPDDMPAHLRAALTQTQLSIPVIGGRPALGTWQGIYLFEHRRAPHRRSIALHLIGQ
jgi:secondary thiamine-phosphate synthase enzyme